jgi:excisionase family DNA binding protein
MTKVIAFVPRTRESAESSPDDGDTFVLSMGERAVYTVKEVAHLLSLSLGGTYALVRDGTIPAKKMGGRWVVPKRRFHVWLDSCIDSPDDLEGGH